MESWKVGQFKMLDKTNMEKSWKVGKPGGEKRRRERGKRRGGIIGRSRVGSERREKVRRESLNEFIPKKTYYLANFLDTKLSNFSNQLYFVGKLDKKSYPILHSRGELW